MDRYTFIIHEDDNTTKKVGVYSVSLETAWKTIRKYYSNNKIEYDDN